MSIFTDPSVFLLYKTDQLQRKIFGETEKSRGIIMCALFNEIIGHVDQ